MILAPDAIEVAGPRGKCESCRSWPVVKEGFDLDRSAFHCTKVSIDK